MSLCANISTKAFCSAESFARRYTWSAENGYEKLGASAVSQTRDVRRKLAAEDIICSFCSLWILVWQSNCFYPSLPLALYSFTCLWATSDSFWISSPLMIVFSIFKWHSCLYALLIEWNRNRLHIWLSDFRWFTSKAANHRKFMHVVEWTRQAANNHLFHKTVFWLKKCTSVACALWWWPATAMSLAFSDCWIFINSKTANRQNIQLGIIVAPVRIQHDCWHSNESYFMQRFECALALEINCIFKHKPLWCSIIRNLFIVKLFDIRESKRDARMCVPCVIRNDQKRMIEKRNG